MEIDGVAPGGFSNFLRMVDGVSAGVGEKPSLPVGSSNLILPRALAPPLVSTNKGQVKSTPCAVSAGA